MNDWEKELSDKLTKFSEDEFNYIDTKDITNADNIDYGCSGVYMEATVIYLEIKNLPYILKENGRRKAAKVYTMLHTVITSIAKKTGAFVNTLSPNAILVVYPGKEAMLSSTSFQSLVWSSPWALTTAISWAPRTCRTTTTTPSPGLALAYTKPCASATSVHARSMSAYLAPSTTTSTRTFALPNAAALASGKK